MMLMDTSIYSRAVAEAKGELAGIRVEYERLAKRKAQLEAFIANGEPLLPPEKEATLRFPTAPPPTFEIPSQEETPIWKAVVLSINGKHNRFTVKDGLEGLERIGRPIQSKNKFQILRAVLMRRPDVFEKIGKGLFRVKEGIVAEGAAEAAPSA
ncbi:MAG TPA: hypothetical protein VHU89_18220 [Acidobacteriaceae bacterium]|jgi:hypothetical protein|nr:hypothetical protein [Acidobacteriaceae bacterium]